MEEFINLNADDFFEIKDDQVFRARSAVSGGAFNDKFSSRFIYKKIVKRGGGNSPAKDEIRFISLFRTKIIYDNIQTGLAIFSDVTEQIMNEQKASGENRYKKPSEANEEYGKISGGSLVPALKRYLSASEGKDRALSFIAIRVNGFENIAANYGSEIENLVISELTAIARKSLRENDFFARRGKDGFVIITPGASPENAGKIAERLHGEIAANDFKTGAPLNCGFGITSAMKKDTAAGIAARIDGALQKIKAVKNKKAVIF